MVCATKLSKGGSVRLLLGASGTRATVAGKPRVEASGVRVVACAAGSVAWVAVKEWLFESLIGSDDRVPAELVFGDTGDAAAVWMATRSIYRMDLPTDEGPAAANWPRSA